MSATQSPAKPSQAAIGPPLLRKHSSSNRISNVANAERDGQVIQHLQSQGKEELAQRLVERSDSGRGQPGRPSRTLDAVTDEQAPTVRGELKILVVSGLPLGFSHGSRMLQDLATSIMLGRSNTTLLAAVMLSSVWSLFLNNFWMAGIGQLAALSGQAYGAGNFRLMGIWLQLFLVFGTIVVVPVIALRWLTEPILLALGIEAELARGAQIYTLWSNASIPFEMWYYSLKEWYASRLIVIPDAVVDAVFIFVRIGVNYVFIFTLDMGLEGAALAMVVSSVGRLLVYVLYTWGVGYADGYWYGWQCGEVCSKSPTVRERWWTLFEMTAPAMIGGILEELQFQICSVIAGRFGEADSAALQLVLNIVLLAFMLAIAGGDITGIRMAKFLGEGRPDLARFVTRVGVAGFFAGSAVLGALVAALMPLFASAVTTDPAVQDKLVEMRWATGLCIPPVSVFIVCATVLTKQGRAHLVAIYTPLCCWLCGFPASIFISQSSFHHGASGVWDGVAIGYFIGSVALFIVWLNSDWQALADQARSRCEMPGDGVPAVMSLQPTGASDGAGS